MHDVIVRITDACFPFKHYKKRSTDDPWIDNATQKKITHRMNIFSRERRSKNWKELKAITDSMIRTRKIKYFQREAEKLAAEGSHRLPYQALKDLCIDEKPKPWTPESLMADATTEELLESLADHFGQISNEFKPIDTRRIPNTYDRPIRPRGTA